MSEHSWLESAGAYALGALAGEERSEFQAHLASCATCRAEVQSLREVTALLAYAAPGEVPPPALRDRVLAEARRVRPIGAARRPGAPVRWIPWLAAAAALVIAVGAERRARLAGARADTLAAQLADRDSLIAGLTGPEVHVVSLAGTGRDPSARVFWNHRLQRFVVMAFDLPAAPSGRTYQLWALAKDKAPASMGTFNTNAHGQAYLVIPVDSSVIQLGFLDKCAVTQEPAGGSPQPTETPRLVGTWVHTD
ncbi:MAG: anti-sigma factor [Gemmatimonadetes bacterium]|nr:anti-sigma factor [Gemmatimonadota bacterium]